MPTRRKLLVVDEPEIVLAPEAKRCPSGFKRVRGTRRCRKHQPSVLPPEMDKHFKTPKPSKSTRKSHTLQGYKEPASKKKTSSEKDTSVDAKHGRIHNLAPHEKRCPNGYTRIPGTRTCKVKQTSVSTTRKAKNTVLVTKDTPNQLVATAENVATSIKLAANSKPNRPLLFPSAGPDYIPAHPLEVGSKTITPSVNKMLIGKAKHDKDAEGWIVAGGDVKSGKITYSRGVSTGGVQTKSMMWNNKLSRSIALTNFVNENVVDCSKIVGPNQYFSNCWFNTFFMVFFVSDKGRKAFKHLRQAMILGTIPASARNTETAIPKPYQKAMFFLNAMISSCFQGVLDDTVDSNNIVQALNAATRKEHRKALFPLLNKFSNPITFYATLIGVLNGDLYPRAWSEYNKISPLRMHEATVRFDDIKRLYQSRHSASAWLDRLFDKTTTPHCIIIHTMEIDKKEQTSRAGKWWKREGKKDNGFGKEFDVKLTDGTKQTYSLDSIVVRDTEKRHFIACLQCNKRGYAFDGASSQRSLWPVEWRSMATGGKISSVIIPRPILSVGEYRPLKIGFAYSYQVALYYRVE